MRKWQIAVLTILVAIAVMLLGHLCRYWFWASVLGL